MCSVRCNSCNQLLYAEKVVENSLTTMGNFPLTNRATITVDKLVCHSCGTIGEIDLLGNSLSDIIYNTNTTIKS